MCSSDLLLPLFLGACSDSGESPVIKIEKLYAKVESEDESSGSGEKDYANQRDELPALKVGDEVKALLLLDGNGAELKTFRLQNDDEVNRQMNRTHQMTFEESIDRRTECSGNQDKYQYKKVNAQRFPRRRPTKRRS